MVLLVADDGGSCVDDVDELGPTVDALVHPNVIVGEFCVAVGAGVGAGVAVCVVLVTVTGVIVGAVGSVPTVGAALIVLKLADCVTMLLKLAPATTLLTAALTTGTPRLGSSGKISTAAKLSPRLLHVLLLSSP